MSKEQRGFIVYGDIQDVLTELDDQQTAQLFRGMVDYFVSGKDPKFTGILKFVFIPIKQQMDRNADKYEKKCEKMRSNANKRWTDMQKHAIASKSNQLDANDANTNINTNINTKTDIDTNTNTKPPESGVASLSSFLISYLNEKAGTNYYVTLSVERLIDGLLGAGYTEDQMRTVIDKKCAEWLNDDKMRSYLRPSTLFGDKFEEYLNAPITLAQEREKDEREKKAKLSKNLEEKNRALGDLRDSLKDAADPMERRILKEQIAILEDSIGIIEGRLS